MATTGTTLNLDLLRDGIHKVFMATFTDDWEIQPPPEPDFATETAEWFAGIDAGDEVARMRRRRRRG
jgi:hypothetical protein